jgi:NADPH:quinone reductase-like Zn-dependent oxidoreductase
MKAVFCPHFGPPDVLEIRETAKPTPKRDEVLVRIHCSAVTQSDIFIRGAKLPLYIQIPFRMMIGFRGPRRGIIGITLSGVVESVGEDVNRFQPGDEIYGMTGFNLSCYAEYVCLPEDDGVALAHKPANLSHDEAVGLAYGGLLAWQYLTQGGIKTAKRVLIYGASGSSGTLAVQLAKHQGAEVTGVCSTRNLELVKRLGADHVPDYTATDTLPDGARYDLVMDSVGGAKTSALKKACKRALAPGGTYISIDDGDMELSTPRLDELREFAEAGLLEVLIDRSYPLEEIVEAHRYVEGGHKRGNVVVTVANGVA